MVIQTDWWQHYGDTDRLMTTLWWCRQTDDNTMVIQKTDDNTMVIQTDWWQHYGDTDRLMTTLWWYRQTDDNTMVIQTDLCGEVVREDSVHSTTFPGHSELCFVQSDCWTWWPTVGIVLKMEATGRTGVFGNHVNAAMCYRRLIEKCDCFCLCVCFPS